MALSSSQLEAFYTLSQALNFTKAAAKLNITQSALSQRVSNLESELGTTLFIRDRSGIKLTETAQDLLRFCQMKNALEEQFLGQIKSNNPKDLSGVLRIGGFSSITTSVLLPVLASFLKKNSNIQLTLHTKELDDLVSLLKSGEIDFMILDDRLQKEELERVPLGSEQYVLVESKDGSDLDVYLDHDENDMTTLSYFKKFKSLTKDIRRFYVDDISGIIEGTRKGLGRSILPAHIVKNDKYLRIVNPKDIMVVPIYLYYYKQPFYSKLHLSFVDEINSKFKNYL